MLKFESKSRLSRLFRMRQTTAENSRARPLAGASRT